MWGSSSEFTKVPLNTMLVFEPLLRKPGLV
jgi:hypothetical protein